MASTFAQHGPTLGDWGTLFGTEPSAGGSTPGGFRYWLCVRHGRIPHGEQCPDCDTETQLDDNNQLALAVLELL